MQNPLHFGLYFTPEHVKIAREQREKAPFEAAWKLLNEHEETELQGALWQGLRFRFQDDQLAGEQGASALLAFLGHGLNPDMTYLDALQEMLIQAQAFETLRDHPALADEIGTFLDAFEERVTYLNNLEYERSYVEAALLAHLNLVAGIVLERDDLFGLATSSYQRMVGEIHPQGYIPAVVEAHDGGGLLRQMMVVGSLVQMAEAAQHVGTDLWGYNVRGVSVMTAFSYLLYYYFYPDKWRWDSNVTNEPFREYGAFLEMVNRRAYPKDLKPILDELRPLFDACGGGLTTLSHGMTGRPKRGLFG